MLRIFLIIFTIVTFQSPCIILSSEGKPNTTESRGSPLVHPTSTEKKDVPRDSATRSQSPSVPFPSVKSPPIQRLPAQPPAVQLPAAQSPPGSVQSTDTQEKTKDIEKVSSRHSIILSALTQYAPLISALAAIFAAFVSLYLGDWRARLRKPELKLYFSEKKEYPYHHQLPFEWYTQPINFVGQTIYILKPGFNARIKIYNNGKTTAKGVQARVEKITLQNVAGNNSPDRFYHPTTIKWSGERNWAPVDIVPESHFFLDLFWAKNEKASEVIDFNNIQYREEIDKDILRGIVQNDICPPEEVYWNVWVDTSYNRGIPIKYDFQGKITIHFIVNGENCGPVKFKALIDWSFDMWNSPNIRVVQGSSYINNE